VEVFFRYLTEGLWNTLQVTTGGIAFALVVSFVVGLAVNAKAAWIKWAARAYVEFFRGTSALVQLMWFYFAVPQLVGVEFPAMAIGILVLGLNIGAYGAEVVRGALAGVDKGQRDAAIAIGLDPGQRLFRVILPQAVPAMLPPFGNLAIELLKASALVMFIEIHDIMKQTEPLRGAFPKDDLAIYALAAGYYAVVALALAGFVRLFELRGPRRLLGRGLQAIGAGIGAALLGATRLLRLAAVPRFVWPALFGSAAAIFAIVFGYRGYHEWDGELTAEIVPRLVGALGVTIKATAGGAAIALVLGLIWASLRRLPWIRRPVFVLTEAIRSTPLLCQLALFGMGVMPALGLDWDVVWVGTVMLGIHYSTYTAEVYRSGIDAVERGQWEAARAIGMSRWQCFSRVVIPQAIPRSVPALGNYVVAMFKETPQLAILAVPELITEAMRIQSDHFRWLEALTLVGVLFLVLSLAAAACIRLTERLMPVRHA